MFGVGHTKKVEEKEGQRPNQSDNKKNLFKEQLLVLPGFAKTNIEKTQVTRASLRTLL